jgi:hypothetical protein
MLPLRHSTFLLLAATIGSAALLAQPAPEPGEATFLVFVRGNQVGIERVALTRSGAGWMFKGSGRLAAPFDLTVRNYELKCTADWQPIDLLVAATFKGQPTSIASSFGLTTVINEINQGGQTSAKTDQISARTIVLPGTFFAAYEALAVRLGGATTATPLRVYLAPQGEVPGQITRVTEQTIQTPGGAVALTRYSITLQRPDAPIEAEVWVDARQRLARLEMPASGLTVSRQDISSVMAARAFRFGDDGRYAEGSRSPAHHPAAGVGALCQRRARQHGGGRDETLWQIRSSGSSPRHRERLHGGALRQARRRPERGPAGGVDDR